MKQQGMSVLAISALVILCLGLPACSSVPASEATKEQKRMDVRNMANDTLQQLYAHYPNAQSELNQAAGYAVFSDFGFKLLFLGGANGEGVAINNSDKQAYYMKMVELQPGLGLGAAKFHVIFLFDTKEAFNDFVNSGWEAGANAMAKAKTDSMNSGGMSAVKFSEGIKMYQITQSGLIVGVSITGAKFYKDSDLN
jgi:lipid-binding SYLF domain-containing protein